MLPLSADSMSMPGRVVYLAAGILPAVGWAVVSLLAVIVPPLIVWTIAAWIGVAGLVKGLGREPYREVHGPTSLMLLVGLVAMAPVAGAMLLNLAEWPYYRQKPNQWLMLLSSLAPMLVALHFLFFQAVVVVSDLVERMTCFSFAAANYGKRVGNQR